MDRIACSTPGTQIDKLFASTHANIRATTTRRAKSDEVGFGGSLSEAEIGICLPVCDCVGDSLLIRQAGIDSEWDNAIGPTKLSAHNHCGELDIGLWILNLV